MATGADAANENASRVLACLRGEHARLITDLPGVVCCGTPEAAAGEVGRGAAVLIVSAELLDGVEAEGLRSVLEAQANWSELPVLAVGQEPPARDVPGLRWVPPDPAILQGTVTSAVRSRRRQYAVRDELQGLREAEQRLRFSLDHGGLGFFQHELETDELICSEPCKAHFGRSPAEPLTHAEILESLVPEDRSTVQEAIRTAVRGRTPYVLEYRVRWPDGSLHWLMVRGRADYAPDGRPLRTFGVTLEITRAKEEARRKDEFLATLAHELRNPLAPVSLALEIMRLRPGSEQDARARAVVDRQIGHMRRLIEDLLDVSRLNTGKITLRREALDLGAAVRHAIEGTRAFIEECGHRLEVELPEEPLVVRADPLRVEQVVTNLLNNAAKYTESGGHIQVAVDQRDGLARVRVRDTGIGIPGWLLGQVFELFTQGEGSQARSHGGLGLGLSLVRSLVQLHGGTVEAFSEGEGCGSEFVVTLPLGGEEGVEPATGLTYHPPREGRPRRLLVVDDNRDAAETLAELVATWGFETATSYSGEQALERAAEWKPDVIFLDIAMPGMDGYEVAQSLRGDGGSATTLLIAVTGYGQPGDIARSRAAGFDHHLVKPVDPAELRRLLQTTAEGYSSSSSVSSAPPESV